MNKKTIEKLKRDAYEKIYYGYEEEGNKLLLQATALEHAMARKNDEINWIG